MTFPTEQDRLFFTSEEAKRIQEEWKNRGPRIGDFFIRPGTDKWEIVDEELLVILSFGIEAFWLPRPHQLWEMLEERGYEWMLWRRGLMQFYRCEFKKDGKPPIERTEGPTPAIALGRALIEMLKEE